MIKIVSLSLSEGELGRKIKIIILDNTMTRKNKIIKVMDSLTIILKKFKSRNIMKRINP
jgi:hypothetical protein